MPLALSCPFAKHMLLHFPGRGHWHCIQNDELFRNFLFGEAFVDQQFGKMIERRLFLPARDHKCTGFFTGALTRPLDLNKAMVARGWALAFRKYSTLYVAEEEQAKAIRLGIWASSFVRPEEYRMANQRREPQQLATPLPGRTRPADRTFSGCVIKGNRNRKGQWIYHPPGLVHLQAALLLAPAVVALLRNTDPAAGIRHRPTLRQHDLSLTQLADDLFRLVLLANFQTPSSSKITRILDHSEGGRSLSAGCLCGPTSFVRSPDCSGSAQTAC